MEVHAQQLGQGISCIDTMLHRPGLAACYLIEQDGMLGFIDTGTSNSVPILLEVLRKRGFQTSQVAYVMPTHAHLDHAGGAGGLMQACPNAVLLAHPRAARHLIEPSRLEQGSLAVYGEEKFAELFGFVQSVAAARVQEVDDNFILNFNGRELLFLDTPGHARHHYCIFDSVSKGLFSGDTCGASYPELNHGKSRFVFAPSTPVQFDPSSWLRTLERLEALNPERLFLTHFGGHDDPPEIFEQLKRSISDYVEIAEEFADSENRRARITQHLMQTSVNQLLDQQCGLDTELIRSLLQQDMELNAQGLDVWLSQR